MGFLNLGSASDEYSGVREEAADSEGWWSGQGRTADVPFFQTGCFRLLTWAFVLRRPRRVRSGTEDGGGSGPRGNDPAGDGDTLLGAINGLRRGR